MLTALHCLALAIYFEARGEPLTGQYLVGQVVLNRVASEKYPDDVCQVVFQPKQFSFTSMKSLFMRNSESRSISFEIASDLLESYDAPDDILYFYNPKLANPGWARKFSHVVKVGNHRFMRP